jgi:hypothetical protein
MQAKPTSLTAPQRRYLTEIAAAPSGERCYNGRARRPLEALEAMGLIEVYWHPEGSQSGGMNTLREVWHARPTKAGRALTETERAVLDGAAKAFGWDRDST